MTFRWVTFVLLLAGGLSFGPLVARVVARAEPATGPRKKSPQIDFTKDIQPLLNEYCYGCHGEKKKGGLDFRIYTNESLALRDRLVFEKVLAKLQAHEMPPENKPQPTPAQCELLTNWVTACFFPCDCN